MNDSQKKQVNPNVFSSFNPPARVVRWRSAEVTSWYANHEFYLYTLELQTTDRGKRLPSFREVTS